MYPSRYCYNGQADHRGQQDQASQLLTDRDPHLDHSAGDTSPVGCRFLSGWSGKARRGLGRCASSEQLRSVDDGRGRKTMFGVWCSYPMDCSKVSSTFPDGAWAMDVEKVNAIGG